MIAFLVSNLAPIMFASLVIVLLLGYPAAFSLGAVGLIYALVGIGLGEFRPDFLQALPERVYGVMNNDTLLAIPFFTFMGLVLERSGMAEDLLDTDRAAVRHRSAAGLPTRWFSSAHYSLQPPAWWRPQ